MEECMSQPDQDGKIFVGKSEKPELLMLAFGNRHGLVTGATGTGKTVTLQTMAEGFSRAGVPVFAADIKGDLSGIAAAGEAKEAFVKRAKDIGFDYETDEFPAVFWDLFGVEGVLLGGSVPLGDVERQTGLHPLGIRRSDGFPPQGSAVRPTAYAMSQPH